MINKKYKKINNHVAESIRKDARNGRRGYWI